MMNLSTGRRGGFSTTGDTGPAGGFIISDRGEGGGPAALWRYVEAAPCCIARASWEEAFRLCEAYRGGGYGDWELASSGELVELLRCGRHGACVDLSSPGWHWAGEQAQKAGVPVKDRAAAVSFWGPSGYWGNTAGHCEIADIANAYAVRPVRRF